MQLTDTHIRAVKPLSKPKKYFDGGGLFLYVTPSGSKLWRMAYRFNKKEKLLSFGPYPTVSLRDVREKREEAKKLLTKNIDPSEHDKSIKAEMLAEAQNSFQNIALEWFETRTTGFSPKHRGVTLSLLKTHIFPAYGHKPITKIEAQDILAVARFFEKRGMLPTARRLVQLTGRILRFAIATGRAKHNTAADLDGALQTSKTVHRASIIDPKNVGKLLFNIENYDGCLYLPIRYALRLMPYVFVRSTELCNAEWSEIDFNASEWHISAQRMKMGDKHIVPLSSQALKLIYELKEVTGDSKYLFPSMRPNTPTINNTSLLLVLRRMGYKKHEMCIHGFRSMASTLLNELGYNRDWIERQLAHSDRRDVRSAYNYAQYLPERRKMMQDWADYLTTLREQAQK